MHGPLGNFPQCWRSHEYFEAFRCAVSTGIPGVVCREFRTPCMLHVFWPLTSPAGNPGLSNCSENWMIWDQLSLGSIAEKNLSLLDRCSVCSGHVTYQNHKEGPGSLCIIKCPIILSLTNIISKEPGMCSLNPQAPRAPKTQKKRISKGLEKYKWPVKM